VIHNAMAAVTAICLLISFIPVAPPRMLTLPGLVDLAAHLWALTARSWSCTARYAR
jgi:hypothetical protein